MAVTDDAIEKIKEMIVSGRLGPGSRLPREADLAAEIGVSRNSLREAVRALALVRILDVRQGDGTYVSSLESDVLLDALGFLLEFHQDDSVLDIFAVRRILEPAAARLAAQHMSDAAIEELRILVDTDRGLTDVGDLVDHDLKFHGAIGVGCGNPVLSSLVESISLPTVRARIWRGITEEGAFARTFTEHGQIVEALAARDGELAAARALVHISGVEHWLQHTKTATG